MEGLSAAASVVAVTSLAFQLAHSTKKLFDFWESIQDAPEDVRKVKTDLKFLTKVLEHIAHGAQQQLPDLLMESALRLCSDKIDTIMSLTLDLEPEFASRKLRIRKWGAFRLILKREKLKRLQKSLDRAKETLMIVQLSHIGYWKLFVFNHFCFPFIFWAADVEVEFYRESSRLRDTAQFEQISALAHKINSLNLKNLEGKVVTTASSASGMAEHTLARNAEVNRVSLSIESDALAFGFRKAAQTAFDRFPATDQGEGGTSDPLVQLRHPMKPAPSGELVHVKRTISQEDRVVETLFGTFRISRKTSILSSDRSSSHVSTKEEDRYEHESRFSLVPPSWLVRLGFTRIISARVLQSSLKGPILGLDTLRTVPYDAPIFKLCSLGDVDGVEALMTGGKASVKDVDLYGRTPLYVS